MFKTIITALPPGDVRLSNPEHVDGSLVQLDEHTIEDLAQTEQLQNFADLRADTIDTRKQGRISLANSPMASFKLVQTTALFVVSDYNWLNENKSLFIVDTSGKERIINHTWLNNIYMDCFISHI